MVIAYLSIYLFSLSDWSFLVSFSLFVALVAHNQYLLLRQAVLGEEKWVHESFAHECKCKYFVPLTAIEKFIFSVFQPSLPVRVVPQEQSWLPIQVTVSVLLWLPSDFSVFVFSPQWKHFHPGRLYKEPSFNLGFAFEIWGKKFLTFTLD